MKTRETITMHDFLRRSKEDRIIVLVPDSGPGSRLARRYLQLLDGVMIHRTRAVEYGQVGVCEWLLKNHSGRLRTIHGQLSSMFKAPGAYSAQRLILG